MSANPTRIDWEETTADAGSPLQEGNRVLESIARREAMRALLAFSDLHEQIRDRRAATGIASDRDLFETERFILDEVLQLICDRAQAITQADSIVVALVEGSVGKGSTMVCRAASGPLTIERGAHLISESEFLQDCLESGRILRCDDCAIDTRVELDFSRQAGVRSTVMVPLRGRREQLGVLQAFSRTPWAFTDHDIRCFDLFGELVLSALKPEDDDRRIHWLSDLAGEILQAKPAAAVAAVVVAAVVADEAIPVPAVPAVDLVVAEAPLVEIAEIETAVKTGLDASPAASPPAPLATPAMAELVPELEVAAQAVVVPATVVEVPEHGLADQTIASEPVADETLESQAFQGKLFEDTSFQDKPFQDKSFEDTSFEAKSFGSEDAATAGEPLRFFLLPFPRRLAAPVSSRPGLSLVLGLLAVAALFSAGAWWGTVHGKAAGTTVIAARAAISPPSVTTPPAPSANVLSPAISDNLMNPSRLGSDAAPLTAVPEDKLAALPKITGVRHWSSSMGSTVVIDMEDQVPYEVHRLMSPERIYFDLHDTVLAPELDGKTMEVGDPSLTRVRIAQPVAGVTRVVLDTKDGSNFSVSMESNPYRLVVELRNSEKTLSANHAPSNHTSSNVATLSHSSAPAKAAPVAALALKASDQPLPARSGKFRIVLDAGHGGWDLGTVGRQGLLEKDLVLDVTQRLGKLLQARLGLEVMFTRTGDTYLPLEQRADFANQTQADLFVSIHANYSSSATARGVETYYTNLFSAPGSREVEKHEDGTFTKLTPVSLSANGLHEKIEESRRLAASVQRSLYATVAANSPDIRNRGIKDSAFVVLTGTTMPAILTEISFVSSPADEHNLQSAVYRQQIAEALYKGIARYQETSPRAKVALLQTTARR
jgi:N-acetylmuramoyl-L-alanine amidase